MGTTNKSDSVIVNNSIAIRKLERKLRNLTWIISISLIITLINLIGIGLLIGGLLTIDAKIE